MNFYSNIKEKLCTIKFSEVTMHINLISGPPRVRLQRVLDPQFRIEFPSTGKKRDPSIPGARRRYPKWDICSDFKIPHPVVHLSRVHCPVTHTTTAHRLVQIPANIRQSYSRSRTAWSYRLSQGLQEYRSRFNRSSENIQVCTYYAYNIVKTLQWRCELPIAALADRVQPDM